MIGGIAVLVNCLGLIVENIDERSLIGYCTDCQDDDHLLENTYGIKRRRLRDVRVR